MARGKGRQLLIATVFNLKKVGFFFSEQLLLFLQVPVKKKEGENGGTNGGTK